MGDLYDIFSPVALPGRTVRLVGPSGPPAEALEKTFRSVGGRFLADDEDAAPDLLLLIDPGPGCETRAPRDAAVCVWHESHPGPDVMRSLAAGLGPARVNGIWVPNGDDGLLGDLALVALFLACPASQPLSGAVLELGFAMAHTDRGAGLQARGRERREGEATTGPSRSPLGLYDTFSPTVLKGRVALVDGAADDLTAAITLELARAGASVGVCALGEPPLEGAIREARAMGRDVRRLEVPDSGPTGVARGAVAQTVDAFGRLDLLVTTPGGARGAYFLKAASGPLAGGTILNLVPANAWRAYPDLDGLREVLRTQAGRSGVRINALGLEEGLAAQQAAWVAVFLASDAAQAVNGQCFVLSG